MKIGHHSVIPENTNITSPLIIGNYCSLAPHIQIHNLVQHASIISRQVVANYSHKIYPHAAANQHPVVIGNDVWIGQGVIILGPITIGDGAIIGAFSVVAKDIPPYAIAVGNPVQIKHYRFSKSVIHKLLQIKWWDWPDEKIKEYQSDLLDIERFVKTHALAKKQK